MALPVIAVLQCFIGVAASSWYSDDDSTDFDDDNVDRQEWHKANAGAFVIGVILIVLVLSGCCCCFCGAVRKRNRENVAMSNNFDQKPPMWAPAGPQQGHPQLVYGQVIVPQAGCPQAGFPQAFQPQAAQPQAAQHQGDYPQWGPTNGAVLAPWVVGAPAPVQVGTSFT